MSSYWKQGLFALVLAIVFYFSTFMLSYAADKGVIATADDDQGTRISLSNITCKDKPGNMIFFEVHANGINFWGCWAVLEEYVLLEYDNGATRMYPIARFKVKPGYQPNNGDDKPHYQGL